MIYIVVNLKREKTKINVTDYDNRSELRQKPKKRAAPRHLLCIKAGMMSRK